MIMTIMASVGISAMRDSLDDANHSLALSTLRELRSEIMLANLEHGLQQSGETIDFFNNDVTNRGYTSPGSSYGSLNPLYELKKKMPKNPLTGEYTLRFISSEYPTASDLTQGGGGWIYSISSERLWLDSEGYLDK